MLTQDEMLEIIAEEGAEVTKAAIKCLRFGFDTHHTDVDWGHNATELAKEVGDVLGMADALGLNPEVIETYRALKLGKAERSKERYGRKDREQALDAERKVIADQARYYASHYEQGSDGANTFTILANWIEERQVNQQEKTQ